MKKLLTAILALCIVIACLLGAVHFGFDFGIPDRSGWKTLPDGTVYYLDRSGVALLGWQNVDGGKYYCDPQSGGALATGWLELAEGRYYLAGDGQPVTGWLNMGGCSYYLDANGILVTGWLDMEDGRRYFDENGRMAVGWLEYADERYYLGEDGTVTTGWTELDGERYYLSDDGAMHTGWLEYENDRYYLRADGTMAVGEVVIDGASHFFASTGKYVVLVNRWHPVPDDYVCELVDYRGYQVDVRCVDALDALLEACQKAGYSYRLNSVYRSLDMQQQIWDDRYKTYIRTGYSAEDAYALVDQSVAVPGTSEHHLGLAADIGGTMEMYAWLKAHSWEYGFVVRYPDDKTDYTGIIYEPWHVRYVGEELAKELTQLDLCMEEYMQMLTGD